MSRCLEFNASTLTPLLVLLLLWMLPLSAIYASGVRGTITDEKGTPLPYATIFIKETGSGTISNQAGVYEIRLSPGTSELQFQFMGYRTEVRQVTVPSDWVTLDVQLQTQPIELRMSGINLGGEDPAYTVMRKAIAKAAFHRQQLDSYKTQVYVKGSGRLIKAPFYARRALKKEGIDSSMAFTSESVSIIEYKRPATFTEKVISIRATGQDNSTSPMPYIQSSFYEPKVVEGVSPLSPKAFGYYQFKLESFFMDRGYGINKIKVTPRNPGENVFEGYIYIVEDYWSIYSLSLSTVQMGIQVELQQVYSPIEEKAWLPISHKFNVTGSVLGFSFTYNYLATTGKYTIVLNPDLAGQFNVIDEQLEKEIAQEMLQRQKEAPANPAPQNRLATGGEVTRKELRKLLTEYEKEEKTASETPEIVQNTSFSIDSLAYKQDSVYWELIRPVPLTEHEIKGNYFRDSITTKQIEADKKQEAERSLSISEDSVQISDKSKTNLFTLQSLLLGGSSTVNKRHRFGHDGVLSRIYFNPVDGFNVHTNLKYTRLGTTPVGITLSPRYAVARERFNLKGTLFVVPQNTPQHNTRWEVGGGRYTVQFNPDEALPELNNAYQNLVKARNFLRLYEKDFFQFGFTQKKASDWILRASFEWANRSRLDNHTTQTWFPRAQYTYGNNTPFAEEYTTPIPLQQKASVLSLSVEVRPWQRYQIRNTRKIPIDNSSPTITLQYRKGIAGLLQSTVNYDFLELEFKHTYTVRAAGTLDLRLISGWFPNHAYTGFADFKHFPGRELHGISTNPIASYRMLPYYQYSTQEAYLSGFAHYQFRKFLFTQIPEVWIMGLKENLFLNYLTTPKANHYVEVGYGLDNILRVLRAEAAVSFEDGTYRGIRLFLGISSSLDNLGIFKN